MKSLFRHLIVLAVVISTAAVQAQVPKPPAQMSDLAQFEGIWTGSITNSMSSTPTIGKTIWTIRPTLDGYYYQFDLEWRAQMGVVKGTGMVGWDAKSNQFKAWTFTNSPGPAGPREEIGKIAGQTLTFEGAMLGTHYRQSFAVKDGKLEYLLEFKVGETWKKAEYGTLERKIGN